MGAISIMFTSVWIVDLVNYYHICFILQNSVEKKHNESQKIWFRTKQAVNLFKVDNKDGFVTVN